MYLVYLHIFHIFSAGGGGGVDFVEAQHGNGLYQEGMAQDTQLQHKILQGNKRRENDFVVTNIFPV